MPLTVRKPLRPSHRGLVIVAALTLPVVSACTANEPVATQPGTTPAVWTGSPAPAAQDGEHGAEHGSAGGGHGESGASGETLVAQLKGPDGSSIATAEFVFEEGYATVTVKTTTAGRLTPGFQCDMTVLSVDPLACKPAELLQARVKLVVINGETVWRAR